VKCYSTFPFPYPVFYLCLTLAPLSPSFHRYSRTLPSCPKNITYPRFRPTMII